MPTIALLHTRLMPQHLCLCAPRRDEDLPRRVYEKENALQKQQLRQAEADAVSDGSKSAIQRAIEIQANAESQELGVAAL
jgi:hypothetical protein